LTLGPLQIVLSLPRVARSRIFGHLDDIQLRLKDPEASVLPNSQPATFLGFRVSRAGVLPGPKMKHRLKMRLAGADASTPDQLARSPIAYRGVLAPF
jgi:hypothetical protein